VQVIIYFAPRGSIGFLSIDLDLSQSVAGLGQSVVALLMMTMGLLYALMVRQSALPPLLHVLTPSAGSHVQEAGERVDAH
jgi:hypothetical protein